MADEEYFDEDAAMEALEAELVARFPQPLPAKGDRLFKHDPEREWMQKVFGPTYLQGYKTAARLLFEEANRSSRECREKRGTPDEPLDEAHWLAYPLYFVYRHSIELALKQILRVQQSQGALDAEGRDLIVRCHDPYMLWMTAKPWVYTFITNDLSCRTGAFESILEEIHEHDDKAEAGRYHERKVGAGKSRRLVPTFEGIAPLDIEVLHSSANKALNYIAWIWGEYEEHLKNEENRRYWEND